MPVVTDGFGTLSGWQDDVADEQGGSLVSRHSPVVAERGSALRLTRIIARMWPSDSVSASCHRAKYFDRAGFVAAPTLLVGGLGAISIARRVAQRGDGVMKGGMVGFDLGDQMNANGGSLLECSPGQCTASTVTTEPASASEASKVWSAGNFIGLFVAIEMCQHQSFVGSKGAEYVCGGRSRSCRSFVARSCHRSRHAATFAVPRVV